MSAETGSYRRRALRGSLMVTVAQVIKIAVQFLSVIILARLLTAEDFGLVAAVGPVVAFVALFQDLGFQHAIVQREKLSEADLDDIFWAAAAFGLLWMVILCALGPAVAWFYKDDRLAWLTAASSLPILLGSLNCVPFGLLARRMQFKALAVADIAAALTGLLVAALLAMAGASYWSLAVAPACAATVLLAMGAGLCRWRPRRPQARMPAADIMRFGTNLTGSNFLSFVSRNLDNILIGRFVGFVELGYYDRAYKLLVFPISNMFYPIGRVMIPVMSRLQQEPERLRTVYLRAVSLLALAGVPGVAAAIATAPELVLFLFGPSWASVADIFAWLGVAGLIQPLNHSTVWLFISQGRTRPMFWWSLFTAATVAIGFALGLWLDGLRGLVITYAVLHYVILLPLQWVVLHRIGPVRLADFAAIQLPLLIAAGLTFVLNAELLRGVLQLGGNGLILSAGLLSYGIALLVLALVPQGRATLREAFHLASTMVVPTIQRLVPARQSRPL